MYKSTKPWIYPLIIIVLSTLCRIMNFIHYFPGCTTDDDYWKDISKFPLFQNVMYTTFYTRAMPYAIGMYVGYLHVYNPTYDFTKGAAIKEWICLFCYSCWSVIGVMPFPSFKFIINSPASV